MISSPFEHSAAALGDGSGIVAALAAACSAVAGISVVAGDGAAAFVLLPVVSGSVAVTASDAAEVHMVLPCAADSVAAAGLTAAFMLPPRALGSAMAADLSAAIGDKAAALVLLPVATGSITAAASDVMAAFSVLPFTAGSVAASTFALLPRAAGSAVPRVLGLQLRRVIVIPGL